MTSELKNTIRAVIISVPKPLSLTQLRKDYKDIPYRQLGHNSLSKFLKSMQDTVRVSKIYVVKIFFQFFLFHVNF